MSDHRLVAVYGTLRRGGTNSHYLKDADYLGDDVLDTITLYDLGPYPGARAEPSDGIAVEVFSVSRAQMDMLDELEGYLPAAPEKGLYTRRLFHTRYGMAAVYLYNPSVEGCRRISAGSWGGET